MDESSFEKQIGMFFEMGTGVEYTSLSARVFLRAIYLVAGEHHKVSDEELLDALRIAIIVATNTKNDTVYWEYFADAHEFIFTASTPLVEFHISHSELGEIYEYRSEFPKPGYGNVIVADNRVNKDNPELEIDIGQLSEDIKSLSNSMQPEELFEAPLWIYPQPKNISKYLNSLNRYFMQRETTWSFWRDWYQGFLDGEPLDWNLQREVALIPDADWDKGPEHIAGKIERIRKKYDLEQEIAALKDMLRLSAINEKPADRLHNHPPEAIDDEIALGKEITLVWEQLDQLEEEIAKPDPSPKLLSKIAQALWDASKRIMAYCGSLADIALKKAAEELGRTGTKWAIRVGVGGVAAQSEGVQSIVKAVWEFVKTLS